MLLGLQLRRLREDRGVTREQAGYQIRCSESKISRLELGRVRFKERDVADLLTYYGITDDAEREPMLALAREGNVPGWWQSYSDVVPDWFDAFVGLEEAAALIRAYEVQFVPGLLQTEDYARGVMTSGHRGVSSDVVERRVSVRMGRQKVLAGPDPPRLWVVVDEAALRRPIGGPKVMRAQVEHLIAMAERPNVVLQVMPLAFGSHAAEGGPFRILRFHEADLPNVVYLEKLGGSIYLDKREDVDRYEEAMTRLVIDASDPAATIDVLGRLVKSR
jgi:transcriptional regulator with XRE-family HTH domain